MTDPALAAAVAELQAWLQRRRPAAWRPRRAARPTRTPTRSAIFDAWWPLLVAGAVQARRSATACTSRWSTPCRSTSRRRAASRAPAPALPGSANEAQAHKGSSFQYGWWGYVEQGPALRARRAGRRPAGRRRTAAAAPWRRCRHGAAGHAAARPRPSRRPRSTRATTHCAAGDQWCADAIVQSPLGGITHAADRLAEPADVPAGRVVPGAPGRHRSPTWPHGRTATASSTQFLTSHTPGKAVDGNPTTRWGSSYNDNQWITGRPRVGPDRGPGGAALGGGLRPRRTGSRCRPTAPPGRTVWSTTTGNGGVDNVDVRADHAPGTCG